MPGKINTDKPMRPRPELDFYETPYRLARAALDHLPEGEAVWIPGIWQPLAPLRILDPGSGTGVWGRAARDRFKTSRLYIEGVEIDSTIPFDNAYSCIRYHDFLAYPTPTEQGELFNYIIGNPPYSLAEEFVRKGLELLAPGGFMIYLLKLDFLAGARRNAGMYRDTPFQGVRVCVQRPSFFGNGKTNAYEFGIFEWYKPLDGQDDLLLDGWDRYLSWLDWKSTDYVDPRTPMEAAKEVTVGTTGSLTSLRSINRGPDQAA